MNTQSLSPAARNGLVVLRLLIGWHFLYEGVIKIYSSTWTAKGYLLSASFLQPVFSWLASDSLIGFVDTANIVALMLVGVLLVLGFKSKWGCWVGIGLLASYYLAHPPFPGLPQGPSEGSYWLVNKNLIEAAALFVLAQFTTDNHFGIARLFSTSKY